MVKKKKIRLPIQELWFQSLGQKDLLEKEMATHSSIFAWEIPWTERRLMGYSPWGRKRVGHDLETKQQQMKPSGSNLE